MQKINGGLIFRSPRMAFKSPEMTHAAMMTDDTYLYWRTGESRWRVQLVRQGRHFENHFSVKAYGSREKAREAALRWRDERYASLPHRKIKFKDRRNRSGIIGVSRTCKTNPTGKQYWSWTGTWSEGGRTHQCKFSILKYGEVLARELAVEARKKGITRDYNSRESPRQNPANRKAF